MSNDGGVVSGELFEQTRAELIVQFGGVSFLPHTVLGIWVHEGARYEDELLRHVFAGDKSWVAGVELAAAIEPPARKPRIWGRRPPGVDPSRPRCVTCF